MRLTWGEEHPEDFICWRNPPPMSYDDALTVFTDAFKRIVHMHRTWMLTPTEYVDHIVGWNEFLKNGTCPP